MTRQGDVLEQRKWELGKMVMNHNLILQRIQKKGDPNTALMKKLSSDFNRTAALAAKYAKSASDPLSPNQKGDRMQFETLMRKAFDIDATLKEIGGTEEGEVPVGVEEDE